MRIILCLILSMLVASAEDIYVAQNAAGSDDGTSCANAKSLTWVNTLGNWGSGANKVSAGDTVRLCGTITNSLILPTSFVAGVVTIYFETGANFTAPSFFHSAIQLNTVTNIIIDGGVNGLIQCTANGPGLAFTNSSRGIGGPSSTQARAYNSAVVNLWITNIFRRPEGSTDTHGYGYGIDIVGSDLMLSNCNVSQCEGAIGLGCLEGEDSKNLYFVNCTNLYFDHGLAVGLPNTSGGISNLIVKGCYFDHRENWDTVSLTFHMDDLFFINNGFSTNVYIKNWFIYRNTHGSNISSAMLGATAATAGTAWYYQGNEPTNVFQFNNIAYFGVSNRWANSAFATVGKNSATFNNTEIGGRSASGPWSSGSRFETYAYNNLGVNVSKNVSPTVTIRDGTNVMTGCTNSLQQAQPATSIHYALTNYFKDTWSDYNVYVNGSISCSVELYENNEGGANYLWQTSLSPLFTDWQTWFGNVYGSGKVCDCLCGLWVLPIWNTTHADPNSTTNMPTFQAGTWIPATNDTVAYMAGTNLTWLLQSVGAPADAYFDHAGNPMPSTGRWTIGAFQTQVATAGPAVTATGRLQGTGRLLFTR